VIQVRAEETTLSSKLTSDGLMCEVLGLRQGDHLCLLYDNGPSEQLPALLPFFRQGLELGEQCIFVADDQTAVEFAASLTEFGIDVEAEADAERLLLWTCAEWRQAGALDVAKKEAQVRDVIDNAQAKGFSGVRFAVEMTWTLAPDLEVAALRRWEALINSIFTPDVPARIICQYNRRRLSPAVVEASLATHPVVIVGDDVCPNPFYQAPSLLRSDGGESASELERLDWMVERLQWARSYDKERNERTHAADVAAPPSGAAQPGQQTYDTIRQAYEDLCYVERMKDEFLGLISHELRTPITTIYGYARLLRDRPESLTMEEREVALADIEAESIRLQRLIENLLVLAQLNRAIDVNPINVEGEMTSVVNKFREKFAARRILVRIQPDLPAVACSVRYLSMILDNLLHNAHMYSPHPELIEVRAELSNGVVKVSVLDRGQGLSEARLEMVFQPFESGKNSFAGGMGVGLAVCRRLVEAYGGTIWAEQRRGGGSCFSFTLALA
jgi:signal transduction histidine kinase